MSIPERDPKELGLRLPCANYLPSTDIGSDTPDPTFSGSCTNQIAKLVTSICVFAKRGELQRRVE